MTDMLSLNRKLRVRVAVTVSLLILAGLFTGYATDHIRTLPPLIALAILDWGVLFATLRALYQAHKHKVKFNRLLCFPVTLILTLFFATYCPAAAEAANVATLVASTPPAGVPVETLYDSNDTAVIGKVNNDRRVLNNDGSPMLDENGNQLTVVTGANGQNTIFAVNKAGQLAQPKLAICEVVVVLVVVGVGTYIVVKLYTCAKKCLYPPTNSPPTNSTPPKEDGNLRTMKASFSPPPPTYFTNANDASGSDANAFSLTDVSANNWHDGDGNPILYGFGMAITNMVDGNGNTFSYQSSSNLMTWKPEICYVTGWMSASNTITVISDCNGIPFATNWSRADGTIVTSRTGVPIRPNCPSQFYRVAPVP